MGSEMCIRDRKASWYQEDRTTGTYLGEYESLADAITAGGTTGDYYYNTNANGFYELDGVGSNSVTTRAGSAEFPAVPYITAETGRVIIWDAQTGGMWKVCGASLYAGLTGAVNSIAAGSGVVLVGVGNGLVRIDFIIGHYEFIQAALIRYNFLSEIGTTTLLTSSNTNYIVNFSVNDVAITTLPNAPIDPATGLPKPTIAVATDGGVSIITDDEIGTVVDIVRSVSAVFNAVSFDENTLFAGSANAGLIWKFDQMPAADVTVVDAGAFALYYDPAFNPTTYGQPRFLGYTGLKTSGDYVGTTGNTVKGLTAISGSMYSFITSDYSTGWMPGDIKGAWLASTDDTDLVGTELFGTYDFTSGWTTVGSPSPLTSTSFTTSSTGGVQKTSTLTAGVAYQVEINIENTSSVNIYFGNINYSVASGAARTLSFTMVSDGTTFYIRNSAAGTTTVNSLSVKLADPDRSVNANGLIVNGTVTKTAVATGSELVAYSGFSASNYLEQPYNADLDFGTGDFCAMWWGQSNNASDVWFDRWSGSGGRFISYLNGSGYLTVSNGTETFTGTVNYADGLRRHFAAVRRSGVLHVYVNGSLVGSTAFASSVDTPSPLVIGQYYSHSASGALTNGDISLLRIGATPPTAEQIRKIYNDEEWMFQEGAQVTLNGSSDEVTALAHDKVTDLLHVGTSGGMSVFDGLVRVSEDATAVTTSISANNSRIVRQ